MYSRAIALSPKNAEAFKRRGNNLAQMGQFDEAIADLNRAVRLAPKDPWVFNKRGLAWFCQGGYRMAVADFTTAIRLRPDLPHAYFFQANIYRHHLGEPEKAIQDYRVSCRLGQAIACQELEKMGINPEEK